MPLWKNLVGRLKQVPDQVVTTPKFDPVQDWIESEEFRKYVQYQMSLDGSFIDSPEHIAIQKRIDEHTPMAGIERIPARAYRVPDRQDW